MLSKRVLVTESLPLPIRGNQTRTFTFDKLLAAGKSDTLKHQSLTVQMTSQPAWYAVMALPYLMEYPYECSEQTFNRLYANALARHVAKVARLRYPESAVPPELRGTFREMGQVAERIVEKAGSVIARRDVEAARELARDDDAMDELHRQLFASVTRPDWPHGTEAAVDITLLGRYYERFADHAVSVGHRVIWLVTGELDPRSEASHEDVEDGSPAFHGG